MRIPEKGALQSLPDLNRSTKAATRGAAQPDPVKRPTGGKDTVSFTETGRELKTAAHHARLVPDIREDRVMQLKRQLEEGSYRVQGDRIAGNLIDETLENNDILNHIDTNA
jgi:negative regulator of flagellin synthesis FlgM